MDPHLRARTSSDDSILALMNSQFHLYFHQEKKSSVATLGLPLQEPCAGFPKKHTA